jgi:hypothetical protein
MVVELLGRRLIGALNKGERSGWSPKAKMVNKSINGSHQNSVLFFARKSGPLLALQPVFVCFWFGFYLAGLVFDSIQSAGRRMAIGFVCCCCCCRSTRALGAETDLASGEPLSHQVTDSSVASEGAAGSS